MYQAKPTHFNLKLQERFENLVTQENLASERVAVAPSETNSYLLFYEKFKGSKLYEFEIFGDTGAYKPVFKINEGKILSACNCKAGINDRLCWHRSYILHGKTKQLTNRSYNYNFKSMIEEYKNAKVILPQKQFHFTAATEGNVHFRKFSLNSVFMFLSSLF